MGRSVDEFNTVIESASITHHATQAEFDGLVGNEKLQHQACARIEFAGQEQAHASTTDVGSLATVVKAVSVQEHRDVDRNGGIVALPAARVIFAEVIRSEGWFRS